MESLNFINPQIIERLEEGRFVPERRSKGSSITMGDRRDTLSPLAIGKRCIRYEPNVFYNRKDLILEMAKGLNDPVQKMLLITGSQGAGKTSLARGIVEMMGGGQEQLLWFDINVHTDFEEITQFLIQYINYISSAVQQTEASKGEQSPKVSEVERSMPIAQPSEKMVLAQLAQNIRQVSHIPLLLVIDNIEYIVDPEYQIQSFSFKEILNFLLSFSNIKMILMGERLPYADISVDSEIVREIKLTGLLEKEGLPLLQYKLENPKPDPLVLQSIFRKSGGSPWLLRVVNYLCLKGIPLLELDQTAFQGSLAGEKSIAGASFIEMLVKNIYHRLSLEEQAIVECLSLIRHPVEIKVLIPMIRLYKPEISPQSFEVILQNLEGSLLKPLLQKNYPPQAVLRQVRSQLQSKLQTRPPDPWFELHHRYLKKVLYNLIPEEERLRAHQFLQEFYLKEKNKPFEQRIYHIKSKGLIAEATFHSNLARKRRKTVIEDASLESRSYLARGQTPAQNDKLLTLDDFRNIKLPETNIPLDPPHFRQPSSSVSQRLPLTSDGNLYEWEERRRIPSATSFPKDDDIVLSESEKQLLFRQDASKSGFSINRPQKMGESPFLDIPFEEDDREKEVFSSDFSTPRNMQDTVLQDNVVQDAIDIQQTDISVALPTRPDEVERNFQQEISSALSSQDHVQVFHLMIQLARYRLSLGLLPSAEECLSKALGLQQGRTPLALAELYAVYASYYKAVGALEKAVSFLLKAVDVLGDEALFREAGDGGLLSENSLSVTLSQGQKRTELMGTVYQELGALSQAQGQLQESARYYYKAIKFYQESKNPLKQAEVIFKVAEIYDEIGRKDLALTFYEQSLALDKAQQNHVSCSITLANLGTLYLEMGRTPQAIRVLLESLAYDRRTRHWEGLYHSLMLLAKAYKSEKELFMAEDAYLQALAVADQENQTFWQASVYLQLGSLNATMQQWKQALEYYQLAAYNAPEDLSERSKQLIEKKIQEAQTHVNP